MPVTAPIVVAPFETAAPDLDEDIRTLARLTAADRRMKELTLRVKARIDAALTARGVEKYDLPSGMHGVIRMPACVVETLDKAAVTTLLTFEQLERCTKRSLRSGYVKLAR